MLSKADGPYITYGKSYTAQGCVENTHHTQHISHYSLKTLETGVDPEQWQLMSSVWSNGE